MTEIDGAQEQAFAWLESRWPATRPASLSPEARRQLRQCSRESRAKTLQAMRRHNKRYFWAKRQRGQK